jgi:hypothetical protein
LKNHRPAFAEGAAIPLGALLWAAFAGTLSYTEKGVVTIPWLSISCVYTQPTARLFIAGAKFMNTGICKGLDARSWKDLYQAALCESDLNKLPERIADAETALAMRTRELSYTSGDKFEEKDSLDDALCILHALRSSLKRRPTAVPATNRVSQLMLSAG